MARTSIATDNFNRASLGTTDWSQMNTGAAGDVQIDSSIRVKGQYSTQPTDQKATVRWIGAGSFTNDQYASIKIVLAPSPPGNPVGVCVRASGSASTRTFYEAFVDGNVGTQTTSLNKWVSGTRTVLYTDTAITWAANDLISLEAEGTTLRVCKNGTAVGGSWTLTDSSISTGAPGVVVSGSGIFGDDWEGGNIAAADTTAPTLTSPGTSSVGSTTVTGNVTTDEANGTLYCLVTTNATETAATVKASGTTQAITTIGAKSINITGLTASTAYYAHFCHRDAAGNDSTVSNSASFTTSAASPTAALSVTLDASVFAGIASVSPLTVLTATMAASVFAGSAGSGALTSLATTTDAAIFSGSASVAGAASLTFPLTNNTGSLWVNQTGATVYVYATTGAHVVTKTAQTSNSSGVMVVTDAALTAATQYRIIVVLSSGDEGMDKVTAA